MTNLKRAFIGAAMATLLCGCDLFDNSRSAGQPLPDPPAYTVTVTSVEIVNPETGQLLDIEGVPVQGSVLSSE
jgi:hypothetical protein